MNKTLIGIYTYLYTFPLTEKGLNDYIKLQSICKKRGGTITKRFINNEYAFEYKCQKI